MAFAPQGLTVIYGDNGAGKSGYARILKRVCRARQAGQITPNVYGDNAPRVASANVKYAIGGTEQPPLRWQDTPQPHAILSAISVFDSECASVHVKEKNIVAFRPFGLDVPDELAGVCQAVKDALLAEYRQLENARNPIFAAPTWQPTTKVGQALAELANVKDATAFHQLATLTPEESDRLTRLRDDLAKNPTKAAAEQTMHADNIKRVIAAVTTAEATTANEALAAVRTCSDDA